MTCVHSKETHEQNVWEKACKEFLKGCTCVAVDRQEDCEECLKAFCDYLRELATKEKYKTNKRCIKP